MIRKSQTEDKPTGPRGEPHNHHETPGRQTKQSNHFSLPYQEDCKTRMHIKQSDTKIDSFPLVSNSLIQTDFRPTICLIADRQSIGLFFILRGKHMTKYDIHMMEPLPGVSETGEMAFIPGEPGTKVKV